MILYVKMFILLSSFTGSPRTMHQNFVDAMVLVQTWKIAFVSYHDL